MIARARLDASAPGPACRRERPGRICRKSEFARVFSRPDRVLRGRYFRILQRDVGRQQARLGLAIARKHSRTAVRRNLMKRLARETFREHCRSLPPSDYVVLSLPAAKEADRRALRQELIDLWERLGRS